VKRPDLESREMPIDLKNQIEKGSDMHNTRYGIMTSTRLSVEAAEDQIRTELAAEGFGILTEIDVAETLKTKLGIDRSPYRILGACNPQLAEQALRAEANVGLLLPCNVVVYEDNEQTIVAALDPATMVDLTANPALEAIAAEAREGLERVIEALSKGGAN
jgi:uncharacterized protein (DUF302 family)